jgi:hypothetical protein
MRTLILIIVAGLLWTLDASAQQIQARLIRATHTEHPSDPALDDVRKELKEKFGFPHYAIMGKARRELVPGNQQRLDLGDGFVVLMTDKTEKADAKKRSVEVEWYSSSTLLVKFTAEIGTKGTVLVKGPEVGKDWIILGLSRSK